MEGEVMKWTGEEKLRLCAIDIRRRAALREQKYRPKKLLTWPQIDARDELARIIGAEAKQKEQDAPPDRHE